MLWETGGCYVSQIPVTYDDFRSMPAAKEASVITNDEKTYLLTTDSLKNNYMYWEKYPDTLTIYSTHLERIWSNTLQVVTDTFRISKNKISQIYISKLDPVRTSILAVVTLIIIGSFIYGFSHMEWHFE